MWPSRRTISLTGMPSSRSFLEVTVECSEGIARLLPFNWVIQAYIRDTTGSVPDHCNKANIKIESNEFFGFPVRISYIYTNTPVCEVYSSIMSKRNPIYFKNFFL